VTTTPAQLPQISRLPVKDDDATLQGVAEIGSALSSLLADVITLYIKTKGFHWHMTGAHFREYHLLLDDQAEQIFAMVDPIAERSRKLGQRTIGSVADVVALRRLADNENTKLGPREMLRGVCADNQDLLGFLRSTHALCDRQNDVATASLFEVWIDETERRVWFLVETLNAA